MMIHLNTCPHCGEAINTYCDSVPNPFQKIHAEHIARILYPENDFPPAEPIPPAFASQLKFMFLLYMLDGELPELKDLPEIPPLFSSYIDHANAPQIKHLMIH